MPEVVVKDGNVDGMDRAENGMERTWWKGLECDGRFGMVPEWCWSLGNGLSEILCDTMLSIMASLVDALSQVTPRIWWVHISNIIVVFSTNHYLVRYSIVVKDLCKSSCKVYPHMQFRYFDDIKKEGNQLTLIFKMDCYCHIGLLIWRSPSIGCKIQVAIVFL